MVIQNDEAQKCTLKHHYSKRLPPATTTNDAINTDCQKKFQNICLVLSLSLMVGLWPAVFPFFISHDPNRHATFFLAELYFVFHSSLAILSHSIHSWFNFDTQSLIHYVSHICLMFSHFFLVIKVFPVIRLTICIAVLSRSCFVVGVFVLLSSV